MDIEEEDEEEEEEPAPFQAAAAETGERGHEHDYRCRGPDPSLRVSAQVAAKGRSGPGVRLGRRVP